MNDCIANLERFIGEEKAFFSVLNTLTDWNSERWNVQNWLFHRGKETKLIFTFPSQAQMKFPAGFSAPENVSLSTIYSDFSKAIAVYMYRTKAAGFMAIRNYINECRRIYVILHRRHENSPIHLTRWHFEETLKWIEEIQYKNIYDATSNLQVICFCS